MGRSITSGSSATYDVVGLNRYSKLRSEIKDLDLCAKNDCAVVAIAFAAHKFGIFADYCSAYESAYIALRDAGRKDGHRTPMSITEAALDSLGLEFERMSTMYFSQMYPGNHKMLKNVTTHHPARFPEAFHPDYVLMFRTSSHILSVIDGHVVDWCAAKSKHVKSIYRITKKQ